MKVFNIILLIFLFTAFFFQSSLYYNNYLTFFNLKVNLVFLILVYTGLYCSLYLLIGCALLAGICTDLGSTAPMGFYSISFFFAVLPLHFIKKYFLNINFPLFLLIIFFISTGKTVIEFILLTVYFNVHGAYSYLTNIAFIEIILNTVFSIPVYIVLSIIRVIFKKSK